MCHAAVRQAQRRHSFIAQRVASVAPPVQDAQAGRCVGLHLKVSFDGGLQNGTTTLLVRGSVTNILCKRRRRKVAVGAGRLRVSAGKIRLRVSARYIVCANERTSKRLKTNLQGAVHGCERLQHRRKRSFQRRGEKWNRDCSVEQFPHACLANNVHKVIVF